MADLWENVDEDRDEDLEDDRSDELEGGLWDDLEDDLEDCGVGIADHGKEALVHARHGHGEQGLSEDLRGGRGGGGCGCEVGG